MTNKLNKIKKAIGNTPIIHIKYKFKNKTRTAHFKAEWYNLTGSIKDRVAFQILYDGIKTHKIMPNQTIVEVTSGNMGISISAISNYLGYKCKIFMPKTMSQERIKLLKMYGAEVILTENFEQAFLFAEIEKQNGAFLCNQFENKSNTKAHQMTTCKEILKQLKNYPCFVAGVGTSGTLIGVGKVLKQKFDTKLIAVEPTESNILTTGKNNGHHKIQGLSDGIIPKLYEKSLVDKIISIKSDDAIAMSQKLSQFGLGVGISSGANFLGCVLSEIDDAISVFPDDNKKYLSTELCDKKISPLCDEIEILDISVN